MRGGPLLLVLTCACAAPAPSRPPVAPGDLVLGTARLTLPPGVIRWSKPGAQTAFGGTLVALDSQVFVELAVLPPTALPLRPYLDIPCSDRPITGQVFQPMRKKLGIRSPG